MKLSSIKGTCVECKEKPQRKKYDKYLPLCGSCYKKKWGSGKKRKRKSQLSLERSYRKYKQNCCSKCGFIPIDMCQLDVDHIDSNHKNNAPENLQTLCANCHRLKTHREHLYLTLGN